MYDDGQQSAETPNVRQMRERIKELEGQNRQLAEAQGRAEQLERELAIRDAGVELDELQRKALFAVHDGEFTAERVRDTATRLGFVQPAAPPAPEVPADELARLRQFQSASAGAPMQPMNDAEREREMDQRLREAKTEEEFDALYRGSGRPMYRRG
jgi:hypothetical protein